MVTPLDLLSSVWVSRKDQKLTTRTTLVQKSPNILVIMLRVRLKGLIENKFHKCFTKNLYSQNLSLPREPVLVLVHDEERVDLPDLVAQDVHDLVYELGVVG